MSKFKVGDFFRRKGESEIYQAKYVGEDWVKGDATPTLAKHCVACPESEVERVEPKTAFLEELRDLLIKYDAEIHEEIAWEPAGVVVYIGNEECHYSGCITPENIMDYHEK